MTMSGCLNQNILNRSEEHTSELQSLTNLVCRLLLEKNNGTSVTKSTNGSSAASPQLMFGLQCDPVPGKLRWLRVDAGRPSWPPFSRIFFFFNDPATTEIYTLSLHDALPI